MAQHYLAGGTFLALAVGGIAYLAVAGVTNSREQMALEARRGLNDSLRKAIHFAQLGKVCVGDLAEPSVTNHPVKVREPDAPCVTGGDRAEEIFQQLLQTHADDPDIWLNLGIARRANEEYQSAEKAFEKVLELDPNDHDAMAELATIQIELGDIDKGIILMNKVPKGAGHVVQRLTEDQVWLELQDDVRMKQLYERQSIQRSAKESSMPQDSLLP